MDGRKHFNTCIFLKHFFPSNYSTTRCKQLAACTERTSQRFLTRFLRWVSMSLSASPRPGWRCKSESSSGSGGNFVPQLGPFASTLDSTRRKGTQTNQNINKLESLLIIVVEAHKGAALQQWHLQSSFLQVYSDQPLVRQTLEAARRILIPPQMWTLVSSQVNIFWHVASSDHVNTQP